MCLDERNDECCIDTQQQLLTTELAPTTDDTYAKTEQKGYQPFPFRVESHTQAQRITLTFSSSLADLAKYIMSHPRLEVSGSLQHEISETSFNTLTNAVEQDDESLCLAVCDL